MPAEKRRKTETPAAVPELGNPDRKRVLNVLAQRRYRQRRRDKVASLEARITSQKGSQSRTELDVAPPLENAANSWPSTVSPEDRPSIEEHIFPSFDGDSMAFDAIDIDFSLFSNFDTRHLPTPLSVYATPDNSTTAAPSISNTLLSSNTSTDPDSERLPLTFPLSPDVNIDVPILATLRAFMTIASLLNIVSDMFNPFALHTSPPTPHPSLPPNLHPVRAQILIPHHPALDMIPWPSVREKLICMLHLPSPQRPPIARGTHGEAIQRIIEDIDDYSSGWRVHGNTAGWSPHHEMAEESWEIGDAFYRNWWFCLDRRIISMTNARRRERGEAGLRLNDVGN